MSDTAIEEADKEVAEKVAPARHSKLVTGLGWLSEVADQPQLITICSATIAAGLLLRNRRLVRAGGRMLATELLATKMKSMVKHRVDRTRPRVVEDGGEYEMRPGSSSDSDENSFPSGHTAGAVGVARAYAREYPEHRAGASGAALAIALIQVPRSQHYLSDLAAGALIGVVADAAVDLVQRSLWAAWERRGAL